MIVTAPETIILASRARSRSMLPLFVVVVGTHVLLSGTSAAQIHTSTEEDLPLARHGRSVGQTSGPAEPAATQTAETPRALALDDQRVPDRRLNLCSQEAPARRPRKPEERRNAMNVIAGGTPRILALPVFALVGTALSEDFQTSRWTVDGGGAMHCTGGDFDLSGTIGQPDTGVMTGGDFQLTAGFWFAVAPGDCNTDGGIDLIDFDSFHSCVVGPASDATPGCTCYDLDKDGDIDLSDIAGFQRSFHGG